jgi:hypothetical protein
MMKAMLAMVVLLVFLVTGAGIVLAQYVPGASKDPSVSQELQKNRKYPQKKEEEQTKAAKEQAETVKETDPKRGDEAGAKLREQKWAKQQEGNKQAHAANKKVMEAHKSGKVAQSADIVTPNYSVSPAVKRDRRLAIDASYLKYYAKPDQLIGEAFWVTERDGAMMLVDPHIYQNIRYMS